MAGRRDIENRYGVALMAAVAGLAISTAIVFFLFYAGWFDRSPLEPTIKKLPWLRLSLLWTIFTVTLGLACRRSPEVAASFGAVVFTCVMLLSHPSSEELRGRVDLSPMALLVFVILHMVGAGVVAWIKKREAIALGQVERGDISERWLAGADQP